jgi:hypothetical protein
MAVYRHFGVSSRAELLARFLRHRIASDHNHPPPDGLSLWNPK